MAPLCGGDSIRRDFAGQRVLASNFEWFVFWRVLGGTAIGLASNLLPLYISEIAPAKMPGRLVAVNQLTIVVGILMAQVVNWWLGRNLESDLPSHLSPEAVRDWISTSWYGTQCWRWMFGLTAVPAALFFLGMFFVPESPRWLVKNRRHETARQVLGKLGNENYASPALADIEGTLVNETEKVNFGELLHPLAVSSRVGSHARRLAAMVRHQRDLQLRGKHLSRSRLRHQTRAKEHRLDRIGQSGVHVCRRWARSIASDGGR